MKNFRYFIVFSIITIFFLSIFSCSNSEEILTPTNNLNTNENDEKTALFQKKSKDVLKYPLGFEPLDTSTIEIKAAPCGYRQVYGRQILEFKTKPGKKIGVWAQNSQPTWNEFYNKYGFSQIAVNTSSYSLAKQLGYTDDNIMGLISNFATAENTILTLNKVKYYHIDEPFEDGTYTNSELIIVANKVSSFNINNAKLLICSYKWPEWWYSFPLQTYGDKYKFVLNNANNALIMCDEYYGNYFGSVSDYWQKFKNYYGTSKNFINWIHLTRNSTLSGTGNSFTDLFSKANNLGINNLWLYALDISNTDRIFNFCYTAFYSNWLRGFAKDVKLIYRCSYVDPCDCDPNEPDGWYLDEIVYVSGLYEVYP